VAAGPPQPDSLPCGGNFETRKIQTTVATIGRATDDPRSLDLAIAGPTDAADLPPGAKLRLISMPTPVRPIKSNGIHQQ
jgi:hypothetical protein